MLRVIASSIAGSSTDGEEALYSISCFSHARPRRISSCALAGWFEPAISSAFAQAASNTATVIMPGVLDPSCNVGDRSCSSAADAGTVRPYGCAVVLLH
ncbi:hypothetical protein D3C81_460390 [compost metagenome]